MNEETAKYDRFSEVFSKLPEESQDKLMKIAHQLLKAHKYAKQETIKKIKTCFNDGFLN